MARVQKSPLPSRERARERGILVAKRHHIGALSAERKDRMAAHRTGGKGSDSRLCAVVCLWLLRYLLCS